MFNVAKRRKRKMKLLLVEDELGTRRELAKLLEFQGYHVTVATDGLTALTRLRRQRFDLMILDTNMPCLNGPELLAELRDRHVQTTVIGMSEVPKDRRHFEHFWCKKEPVKKLLALIGPLLPKVSVGRPRVPLTLCQSMA